MIVKCPLSHNISNYVRHMSRYPRMSIGGDTFFNVQCKYTDPSLSSS